MSAFTATAKLAGIVHGVVVQMAKEAPSNAAWPLHSTRGIPTKMLLDLCPGGYSSSASAKAVLLEGDQFTGFRPL